ncbi:uncharacterized protein LOC143276084 [Babylonia areolata]|uniref:uncharacterized protein LOC143276084 n=1 Tax=Babylonia areolata TaxID=304850 RepID=UPI003FCF924A
MTRSNTLTSTAQKPSCDDDDASADCCECAASDVTPFMSSAPGSLGKDVVITVHDADLLTGKKENDAGGGGDVIGAGGGGDVRGQGDVDAGWAWVVLVASCVSLAVQEVMYSTVGMFQVEFQTALGGSRGFLAMIGSIYVTCTGMLAPVAGALCTQLTPRVTLMLGGSLLTVGLVSASFVSSSTLLLLTYGILGGLGNALIYTPALTAFSKYFVRLRQVANGLIMASSGIGQLIGPYLARWVLDSQGWRFSLASCGFLTAQVCVLGALVFPPSSGSPGLRFNTATLPPCSRVATRGEKREEKEEEKKEKIWREEEEMMLKKRSARKEGEKKEKWMEEEEDMILKKRMVREEEEEEEEKKEKWMEEEERRMKRVKGEDGKEKEAAARSARLTPGDDRSANGWIGAEGGGGGGGGDKRGGGELDEEVGGSFRSRLLGVVRTRGVWLVSVSTMLMMTGYNIVVLHQPSYIHSLGMSSHHFPDLFLAFGSSMMFSRVAGGFIFTRFDRHLVPAMLLCQVTMALTLGLWPLYGVTVPALFVANVLTGLSFGVGFMLATPVLINIIGIRLLPLAYGLMLLCCGTGSMISVSLAGLLYDLLGTYTGSFYLAGCLTGTGALVLLLLVLVGGQKTEKTRHTLYTHT